MTRIVLLRKHTLHIVYADNRKSPQEHRFFTRQGKVNKIRQLPVPWEVVVKGVTYTKVKVGISNLPPTQPKH